MINILFFLPTLGNGGAEKVLVNLVNNMNYDKFSVTVMTLFDIGENKENLGERVQYKFFFKRYHKGIAKIMQLFSPRWLHKFVIRDKYDVEVAYLEGIATRIISGCCNFNTKTIAWVHTEFSDKDFAIRNYRNYKEALNCYEKYDSIVCVSKQVMNRLCEIFVVDSHKVCVQYNTIDSERIRQMSLEDIDDVEFKQSEINVIGVGKVIKNKGFDRLARIQQKLQEEKIPIHMYIVGKGEEQENIKAYLSEKNISDIYTFLGYKKNPYKYVRKSDLFVCSSLREGFSTAATEALIVGTPVISVEVSGMRELLGENNEYGIVVKNNEEELYRALKDIASQKEKLKYYSRMAAIRGEQFCLNRTVTETERMIERVVINN